jgi:hypothetical protein
MTAPKFRGSCIFWKNAISMLFKQNWERWCIPHDDTHLACVSPLSYMQENAIHAHQHHSPYALTLLYELIFICIWCTSIYFHFCKKAKYLTISSLHALNLNCIKFYFYFLNKKTSSQLIVLKKHLTRICNLFAFHMVCMKPELVCLGDKSITKDTKTHQKMF